MKNFFPREIFDRYAAGTELAAVGYFTGAHLLHPKFPVTVGSPSLILVQRGSLEITKDDGVMKVTGPACLSAPFRQRISEARTSEDFAGWTVFIHEGVLASFIRRYYPLQSMSFEQIRSLDGVHGLQDNRLREFTSIFEALYIAILDKDNFYYRNIVFGYLYILLLNYVDILIRSIKDTAVPGGTVPASQIAKIHELLKLLGENIREHPDTGFYAERLRISKQQLALMTKKHLKTTISSLIAQYRLEQALSLMRNPTLSLQQISDMLSFSDQAAFGKFFKKHKGVSPKEFRKKSQNILQGI